MSRARAASGHMPFTGHRNVAEVVFDILSKAPCRRCGVKREIPCGYFACPKLDNISRINAARIRKQEC